MTLSEAGHPGGEARKRELGPEGYSRLGHMGGARSWTTGAEGARLPTVTEEERERVEAIRAKHGRGEELTVEEAGFLGGIGRMEQASSDRR